MTEDCVLPLRALAPAKVNLGLFVGPTTGSGRHELSTVIQSISLADELTLGWAGGTLNSDGTRARVASRLSGTTTDDEVHCPAVPGPPSDNLAAHALRAFRRSTGWDGPPVRLTITKRVPVAAGLGGGSADAACALRLVAAAAGHRGPDADAQLLDLAAELGSDVPAMMDPGRWLVRGTGERLLRLPDPGDELAVLVVPSAARLSTAAVYRECDRLDAPRPAGELAAHADAILEALSDATALPPVDLLANDLEGAARSLCPSVDEALGGVRASAPDATMVSGSGPTVVGLFVGAGSRRRAQRAADGLGGLRPAVVVATAVGNGFGHPAAIDSA